MGTVAFTFEVTRIPDSPGLRIQTVNHFGVIVSSRDPELAQAYFYELALRVTLDRKLCHTEDGGGVRIFRQSDWQTCLNNGSGLLEVTTVAPGEATSDQQIPIQPGKGLTIEIFGHEDTARPNVNVYVARDPGDVVDDWIVTAFHEQMKQQEVGRQ